ncbi:hypothetical protein OH76DRAFT_1483550 [Lentinus brumalis]|uniref:Uncharacterized protein n=1 Tax=Lentinus brumalis TaxID=2498619 RepID=A0A371D874_9APHY|nr:hypothetical protein OH76DRAFT_1483550 [Polyporus brumalis]
MAHSLADSGHIVSNGCDSTGWGSDDVCGDTIRYTTSIALQFKGMFCSCIITRKLAVRETGANNPSVTGVVKTSRSGVPVAAIVGASVAGVVVLLVAGLCVYFLWWRRRRPRGVVKDEEVVYFPDTHPLLDHTDTVAIPRDSNADLLTLSPDPDTHPFAYPNTPPLLGSTLRGYFPSAPASERSTPVVPSASLSAMSASSSLSRGDAEPELGPLAALGKAARGHMKAGVVDAPRDRMGAGVGPVDDSGTVHVAEGASPVHAGYDIHSAVRLHSMHASVALASRRGIA